MPMRARDLIAYRLLTSRALRPTDARPFAAVVVEYFSRVRGASEAAAAAAQLLDCIATSPSRSPTQQALLYFSDVPSTGLRVPATPSDAAAPATTVPASTADLSLRAQELVFFMQAFRSVASIRHCCGTSTLYRHGRVFLTLPEASSFANSLLAPYVLLGALLHNERLMLFEEMRCWPGSGGQHPVAADRLLLAALGLYRVAAARLRRRVAIAARAVGPERSILFFFAKDVAAAMVVPTTTQAAVDAVFDGVQERLSTPADLWAAGVVPGLPPDMLMDLARELVKPSWSRIQRHSATSRARSKALFEALAADDGETAFFIACDLVTLIGDDFRSLLPARKPALSTAPGAASGTFAKRRLSTARFGGSELFSQQH
jgi:hypothetical protein